MDRLAGSRACCTLLGGHWWWGGEAHITSDQAVHKWSIVEVCLSKGCCAGTLQWEPDSSVPSNWSCAGTYQMQLCKSHHNPVIFMQGQEESGRQGRLRRQNERYWRDQKSDSHVYKIDPRWILSSKCAIIFISSPVHNLFQPAKSYSIIKKLKSFLVRLHFSLCLNSDAFQACNSLGS